MRLLAALLSASLIAAPLAAQSVDRVMINRIIDQGTTRSEVMDTAAHLTDRIGGRLTNSPQMREAERWTQARFRDWGLSNVRAEGEDTQAYNILADIPGTDRSAGYVMAGAHLDSWVASDGAQDNAAGSAVVMEAARILARLGIRPKRTIRFALWSGEEQGILGSLAYTERHLATRPAETDPARARLPNNRTWRQRWPLSPLPGHRELTAYFNLDNGSGKIRGIHAEGNVAAVPIFQDWLAPFASMGATQVSITPTGGTDHVYLQAAGIPGYQFIQDPLDYSSRIHHSSLDSYDHLKAADLRQAAIIMAAFLLQAANRDEPLPRMPLPAQPRPSDPFEYPEED